ncbi:MAG: CDP-diacylglycerol--glycerol-3-phosphate 3-phosphatidyltransferase [Lachnospiraceae bacterium]|nr:CDP-diacylglycerol--glycerol-3-phosphate 3-phosphatidyltransferase [Lachnospiraceae bacterium]
MNLPNKLTLLRVIMIPFFVVFMLAGISSGGEITRGYDKWVALVIFTAASLTDFFDGRIARKHNLITNFGKLMDPLADKLLVCAALICLTALDRLSAWVTIIIIAREFVISGVRQLAAEGGRVIAASYWGKFKTASQMVMIILMILDLDALRVPETVFVYLALILTLVSMVDYLVKNRDIITSGGI